MIKEMVWKWFQEFADQRERTNAPSQYQEKEKNRVLRREVGAAVMAAFEGKVDHPDIIMYFGEIKNGHVVTTFTKALEWAVANKGRDAMSEKMKELLAEFNKEEFIDKVVDRINRKQLRPGER